MIWGSALWSTARSLRCSWPPCRFNKGKTASSKVRTIAASSGGMSISTASNTSDLLCFRADIWQMIAQETSPLCPMYLCQLWRPGCSQWPRGSQLVRRPDYEARRGRKPEGAAPPCEISERACRQLAHDLDRYCDSMAMCFHQQMAQLCDLAAVSTVESTETAQPF